GVGGLDVGGLDVGGSLARGLRVGGFGGRGLVLGSTVLGSTVLGSTVLGSTVLGSTAPGGLRRLARGLALLGAFLGFLGCLALLGRGREALLLVRARFGGAEGALGSRFPGDLLPVPGDLAQDADLVGALRGR